MELDESALQSLIEDYGNVVYSVSYDGDRRGIRVALEFCIA